MSIDTFSGVVNTAGDFETIASLSSITLASGTTYRIYVSGQCQIKIGDYVVPKFNCEFDFKAGSEDIKINTGANDITLGVLELE